MKSKTSNKSIFLKKSTRDALKREGWTEDQIDYVDVSIVKDKIEELFG